MSIAQEPIFQWMSQFAYEPTMVYMALVGMMILSSIGFPLPEEVSLVSVGILAFMGRHPDLFSPPYVGAPVVEVHTAAWVAFLAVFCSDFFIYFLGRVYGRKLLEKPALKRFFPDVMMQKAEAWTKKYGPIACGIFRFTPGLRFPGHLACGIFKFPAWKFAMIDGLAALLSVPTQIYLLAYHGEIILTKLHEFKMTLLIVGLIVLAVYIARRWYLSRFASGAAQ